MKVLRFGHAPLKYDQAFFDKLISLLETPNVQQQKPVLDAFGTIRVQTTDTLLAASDSTVLVNTTAGDVTIKLPAVPFQGQSFAIKKISTDTNTLTIDRNGNDIDGTAADITSAATDLPTFRLQFLLPSGWWSV
jgi:hypothetical protein